MRSRVVLAGPASEGTVSCRDNSKKMGHMDLIRWAISWPAWPLACSRTIEMSAKEMPKARSGKILAMESAHLQVRREVRYPLEIEIEVSGIDGGGEVFHERTRTRNVSEWGCAFTSSIELEVDAIIAVRRVSNSTGRIEQQRTAMFQVVRIDREDEKWIVGAWRFGGEDVWEIDFENAPEPQQGNIASRKARNKRGERQGDSR
jgi:hypothetical protein